MIKNQKQDSDGEICNFSVDDRGKLYPNCPENHGLRKFKLQCDDYHCDLCG